LPTVNRTLPTVNRTLPTVNRTLPTVNRTLPTVLPVLRTPRLCSSVGLLLPRLGRPAAVPASRLWRSVSWRRSRRCRLRPRRVPGSSGVSVRRRRPTACPGPLGRFVGRSRRPSRSGGCGARRRRRRRGRGSRRWRALTGPCFGGLPLPSPVSVRGCGPGRGAGTGGRRCHRLEGDERDYQDGKYCSPSSPGTHTTSIS